MVRLVLTVMGRSAVSSSLLFMWREPRLIELGVDMARLGIIFSEGGAMAEAAWLFHLMIMPAV